jgi:ABC-type branched-subunit amino acid transport system substrate-binding protein
MFGGTANNISADVAEAFSSGQVLAQAIDHTKSTSNSALQTYLHSGVTFQSVQGPVKFLADGENGAATPFVFQWQKGTLQDVLPAGVGAPKPIMAVKPAWGANG